MSKLITSRLAATLIGILFFATASVSFAISPQAFASTQGLSLSPLRQELTIAPGASIRQTLSVANTTDQQMTVQLSSEVFSVINPEYDYRFTTESNVLGWVRFAEPQVVLQPDESRSIAYDVAVPVNTEPGGVYISVFVSYDSSQDTTAITSRQRVGLLLYITVEGDVSRNGTLVSLSSPWVVSGETPWSATIQNSGTAHFRSRYEVVVKDVFGGTTSRTLADALILPATVRRVTEPLSLPYWPGVYIAEYTIGLGDQPAFRETRTFLYMPLWLMAIVGVGAVLALFGVVRQKSKQTS